MWKKQYQPRYGNVIEPSFMKPQLLVPSNHVPWAIIAACIGTCAILILTLRYVLYFENKRRDGEQRDETYDDVYLTQETEDGIKAEKRVDKVTNGSSYLKRKKTRLLTAITKLDFPRPYGHSEP